MKMADAKQKRNEQLKRWLGSETDREPPVLKKKKTKVKFDDSAVFLAACSSGDTEEVLRMLERGADIDCANVDGLTALHQACIDDNLDMVIFLVEHGACVNQPDNEGWIPLHAAASCGYLDIAEYLISQGANVGVVNSEGETPLDIAEEEAMEELLQNEINRQGVDIETARKEEERIMLRDARQWLNSGHIADTRHAKSGGTALHVAAAKGYTEVLKLLIQAGYDVNVKDYDGWTPLHAAAHWGKEEACRMLVESLCDMDAVNKVGQTAFDVADEDVLGYLEELQKKQTLLLSEKREKKSPLIETTTKVDNNQPLKPLNKETLLLEPEKTVPRIESLEPEKADDGEQEGKKDESSCSSEEEEEEDSESEAEADKSKPPTTVHNTNSNAPVAPPSVTVSSPTSPTNQVVPTSPVKKFPSTTGKVSPKEEERKDESPASWRLGLRKTGSYGALAEITGSKEAQKKDTVGVMRSASSPRLSSSLDNKDKEKDKGTRLAYVTPTIPSRRINSMTDIDEKENSSSFGRRQDDALNSSITSSPTSTTTTFTTPSSSSTLTSPTGHRSLLSGSSFRTSSSRCAHLVVPGSLGTWSLPHCVSPPGRSYLTPVRDEESESQRKARSRQARQTRRSTQGVTLTDLQEAEKTIGRSRSSRAREEEKEEKQDKEKKETESKENDYRSKYRSFEEVSAHYYFFLITVQTNTVDTLSSLTLQYTTRFLLYWVLRPDSRSDQKDEGEKEGEDKSQTRTIRERRRPREKRRSTGVPVWNRDVSALWWVVRSTSEKLSFCRNDLGLTSTTSTERYDYLGRSSRESRSLYSSRLDKDDTTDYKKLYEQILAENEKLKAQLRDMELELTDLKLQLEKATQVDRSTVLSEKRALERKIADMEEELKMLPDLKADNQRLKDENGALIRVISKLSK
uniref:Protein phosphatase 1 regulatory subunit n=1 Tax=Scleropages formosus TaxID=113540 RepID=A0A8C9TC94_SCLFO